MKKLLVSAFALAMMSTGAIAGEQLSTAQLDEVTAGWGGIQANINVTKQTAVAVADGSNKCAFSLCGGGAVAAASNTNHTAQVNFD